MAKFLIYVAVYVLLVKDGKVLLLRRANTGYMDGMYSLPAGHVEEGESLIEAALRELKEETGVVAAPSDIAVKHAMYRRCDRNYADYFLVCGNWQGEPANMEPAKCGELRWAELASLPENMTPEVKQALACIVAGQPFSELKF
ncbi:MAG: NUDIX domain-containing protein [Pseudomonadaceae bacterium]|nr:NUDIX domain-containing protein [Pseudomonadaceae bacterium]